ncbi:hypothetical protein ANN_00659 [Periplaneta americana]|uniref:Uncharacterized protein n=1 Tax=Periplaneta americana TaxID=6978 RepID=A0ABQ8TRH9_PERAM|nr:hypothetical protein ANN_00659 [Periplaneta americana]
MPILESNLETKVKIGHHIKYVEYALKNFVIGSTAEDSRCLLEYLWFGESSDRCKEKLTTAVREGKREKVKILLSNHRSTIDTDCTDENGDPLIYIAGREGHWETANLLVTHGFNDEVENSDGENVYSLPDSEQKKAFENWVHVWGGPGPECSEKANQALCTLIYEGDRKALEQGISYAEERLCCIGGLDIYNNSALTLLRTKEYMEFYRRLLPRACHKPTFRFGTLIDCEIFPWHCLYNWNVLHHHINEKNWNEVEHMIRIISLLNITDHNDRDYRGNTPLHMLADSDKWDTAVKLINVTSNLTVPDMHGNSIMLKAAVKRIWEVVELLMNKGVNIKLLSESRTGDNAGEMNPGSSTESYPAFARIGSRENPGKNLNQVTCPDRESNPGHLVSQPDALTVTPQKSVKQCARQTGINRSSVQRIVKTGKWKVYIPRLLRAINEDDPDRPPLIGCPRLLIQFIRSYPPYLEAVSSFVYLRRAV